MRERALDCVFDQFGIVSQFLELLSTSAHTVRAGYTCQFEVRDTFACAMLLPIRDDFPVLQQPSQQPL